MDATRWERIQTLFHRAAELPDREHRAFLSTECAGDDALADEVMALLREDSRGDSLLDRGVASVAGDVIGQTVRPTLPLEPFGPYHVTGVLGEGGMGVVYLAERDDIGSVAAIKILRDAWLSPARRERFVVEQRTLAQLDHPAIARLYDADTLRDGTPFFVMEYVEGVALTEYCRLHASPLAERLRLFRAVCEAVQHAHGRLVIHRDLKPSNILVRPDGSVKLLDFGIAKQLDPRHAPVDQTRTGLRLMTPAYAAPEQIRGERVGVQTDVYSLGVVLYELLAGRLPFDLSDRTPGEAETIILDREPDPPSVAASGARPALTTRGAWADLDVLCLTAMHKDAARRYQTVEALLRDVDHFLGGEPLEARPDSARYRVGKFVRRNRTPLAAAGAALALVIALVAFYTVRLAGARNAALAEAARTQRIQRFTLSLLQGGDEIAGPAESLRVVTLVDRGLQDARALVNEPAVQAELYETLGGIYQKLGNLARADSLLNESLAERRSLFGTEHADVASSLLALGLLRADQAKLEDAERLVRQGLEMSRRALPADHAQVARATAALGRVLEERGSYDQAIAVLGEAVRLRAARSADGPELNAELRELANTHFYAGHFATADSLDRVVLAMTRRLFGDRHPLVAEDLINLGAVQHERGQYVEAERYYRQALEITRAFYGPDHYKTASNLSMLGRSLVFQDRFDEAEALLKQSLAIHERVFGPVHPKVASALNELGGVALQRGRYDDAAADFRRIIEIYRAVYGRDHYVIGVAVANLASVYLAQHAYDRADSLFRQALAIYSRTLPADHINVGITRIKLGRALLRRRRFAEAATESQAGYEILARQTSPSVSWLQAARRDLVAAYDSLGKPERAARFRAELAADSAARK